MAYDVLTIDLGTALTRSPIVPPATPFAGVSVLRCPVGADVQLCIGKNSPLVPVAEGDEWPQCPDATDGLFLTIGPSQSGTLVLYIAGAQSPGLERL